MRGAPGRSPTAATPGRPRRNGLAPGSARRSLVVRALLAVEHRQPLALAGPRRLLKPHRGVRAERLLEGELALGDRSRTDRSWRDHSARRSAQVRIARASDK